MTLFRKPVRDVGRVFLHCSASADPSLEGEALATTIDLWHRARGFDRIGYHFVIDFAGTVTAGRSLELKPAAQAGHNTATIAICCHGLDRSDFTPDQMASLIDLCRQIDAAYGGAVTFHGHCEVAAKLCPVFDYQAVLGLDTAGRMANQPDQVTV